jgi:hypothetical protein
MRRCGRLFIVSFIHGKPSLHELHGQGFRRERGTWFLALEAAWTRCGETPGLRRFILLRSQQALSLPPFLRERLAFSVASLSFHVLADILKVDVMHARHFA